MFYAYGAGSQIMWPTSAIARNECLFMWCGDSSDLRRRGCMRVRGRGQLPERSCGLKKTRNHLRWIALHWSRRHQPVVIISESKEV